MDLPGPFPVGRYAKKLQEEMRKRARVQLMGEVTGVGRSKIQAFFELRDAEGAVPCTIWLNDLERPGCRRGRCATAPNWSSPAGPTTTPAAARPRPASASAPPTCGWQAKATCWRAWRRCASSCAPRACSSCRSSWRGRCCRRRSGWSRRNPAPPAATSSPAWRGAAGAGPWSGPSRRSRTATRRRRSPRRSRTWRRGRRSRRSSSPAAAAASPTSGPSATRPSAAPWRCCGCRWSARSATSATRP